MECGRCRGIKLMEHAMEVLERVVYGMEFGFMKGNGTTVLRMDCETKRR